VTNLSVSHKLVPSTAQSAGIELITLVMTDSECYYAIAILFYYCLLLMKLI